MKILKIELKNINSLKTNDSFLIDFEDDKFKDVGLFAITGPTGSGKTTILDAITIALYNRVPRDNSKTFLTNLVSYGSSIAFSKVTFENNNIIYQAEWHIRIKKKNGELLKNPKEEIKLLNLSENKTITSSKSELEKNIEKITLLNYDQFLRSVMLAQGEFASFLSAKNTDKGELLQQITGENIYIKIGQQAHKHKAEEKEKKNKLQSELNNIDILSEENIIIFNNDLLELKTRLEEITKTIQVNKSSLNWLHEDNKLKKSLIKYNKDLEEVNSREYSQKNNFLKIEEFQKVIPLKKDILELKSNTSKINEIKKIESIFETELSTLSKDLLRSKSEEKDLENIQKDAKKEFEIWIPKFDEITSLDTNISNFKKNLDATNFNIEEFKKENETTLKDENRKVLEHNEIVKFQEKNKIEIEANKNLEEIEKQFSTWQTSFDNRLAHHKQENKIQEKIRSNTQENTKFVNEKNRVTKNNLTLNSRLEAQRKELNELLKANENLVFQELNSNKDELISKRDKWKNLQIISKNNADIKQKINLNKIDTNSYSERKTALETESKNLKQKIEYAKKELEKEEEIYQLKNQIINLNSERLKLEKNKACLLCGSKEHPLVENYKKIDASNTKKKIDELKINYNLLSNENSKLDSQISTTKTLIAQQKEKLKELNLNKEKLNLEFKTNEIQIENINAIDEIISDIELKLVKNKEDILKFTIFNTEKTKLDTEIKNLTSKNNQIESELKVLENNIESSNRLKNESIKEHSSIREIIDQEENFLKEELSLFQINLPEIKNQKDFLHNKQKEINDFKNTKNEYNKNKQKLELLESQLKNISAKKTDLIEKERKEIEKKNDLTSKIKDSTENRKAILSLEISVNTKRNQLQENLEKANERLKENLTKINSLTNKKELKNQEINQLKKEFKVLNEGLKDLNYKLNLEISKLNLSFPKVENILKQELEIEELILIKDKIFDDKKNITAFQRDIKEQISIHEKSKNFTETEEELNFILKEIEEEEKNLLIKKGEFKNKLKIDSEIKSRNKETFAKLETINKNLDKWEELIRLLGGSQKSFNTYVQRLTLQNLIKLANIHLYELNNRYTLEIQERYQPGEELNFLLRDNFQANQLRLVNTSSGGEKFIISLALALGLSDLSSKQVNIGSLFIDEGFGTLDNQSLEMVMSSLETLKNKGKMIGIISHVNSLKERISTQIKVSKKHNGTSDLKITQL